MGMNLPALKNLEPTSSLEDMLEASKSLGEIGVSYMGDGWYCRIEMYVEAKGASFEVKSDFRMPTSRSAVLQCLQRVDQIIGRFSG